jgi:hypothetical protein
MKAFLEINAGVIRVMGDAHNYGDVYDFALFVVGDEDTAILKGLRMDDQRFTVHHKRAIMRCLKDAGFNRMCWDRYKRGENGLEKRKFVLELTAQTSSGIRPEMGRPARTASAA